MKRSVVLLVMMFLVAMLILANAQTGIPLPEGSVARYGLGSINAIAYSPDGELIAVGTSIGLELHKAETLELIGFLVGHTSYVTSVAFSPDGEMLASGSLDHTIKLWDVSSGVLLRTLTGHTGNVLSVAFSPDGKTLASGSSDDTIKLWDVSRGALIRTLTGHTGSVWSPPLPTRLTGRRWWLQGRRTTRSSCGMYRVAC